MHYQEHFDLSCKKRETFWKSIGELYSDVISNLINPTFRGGPKWPSLRQAHIGIKTNTHTIIATDGLSDPYDDFDSNEDNQKYNGLGLELYTITPNEYHDIPSIIDSWEFKLLQQISSTAVSNPNLIGTLNKYRYISLTVDGNGLPESFIDQNGACCALLGLENHIVPKDLELSIENILMVNVILLKPEELEYIMENGAKGRIEVAEKLLEETNYNILQNDRTSVIKGIHDERI